MGKDSLLSVAYFCQWLRNGWKPIFRKYVYHILNRFSAITKHTSAAWLFATTSPYLSWLALLKIANISLSNTYLMEQSSTADFSLWFSTIIAVDSCFLLKFYFYIFPGPDGSHWYIGSSANERLTVQKRDIVWVWNHQWISRGFIQMRKIWGSLNNSNDFGTCTRTSLSIQRSTLCVCFQFT